MDERAENKLIPGLKEKEIRFIVESLQRFPEVEQAFLFGSRAKESHKAGSDVDIAIKGDSLTEKTISALRLILNEESVLPYQFDILNYNTIKSEKLLGHINRVGITIYSKPISST